MIKWAALLLGIVLNASANILIKHAMAHNPQRTGFNISYLIMVVLNPFLIAGIICFGLALGAYSYSLTKFELSVAYPLMTSMGLVIVALTSAFVFKESFGFFKVLGTVLIILGVVFVARTN